MRQDGCASTRLRATATSCATPRLAEALYIVSMAAIFRRAGLRTNVLSLWQDDLRRSLAGPGGRRGRDDDEVVAEATRRSDATRECRSANSAGRPPRP